MKNEGRFRNEAALGICVVQWLGIDFLCVAERQPDDHFPPSTIDGYVDDITGLVLFHDGSDVGGVDDLFVVDADDKIAADQNRHVAEVGLFAAAAYSGTIGRASGNDFLHEHTGC